MTPNDNNNAQTEGEMKIDIENKGTGRDMAWDVLDSKYIIRRPWLTARCDTVRLPTGEVNDEYYVLEYPDWVNIVAITDDGRYVMVRQYRHGIRQTCHEIVAGVCEKGEPPIVSAKRELLEETGFSGGEWHEIMTISANTSTMNNLCHCFVATGVRKTSGQHLDRTEDIEVCIMSEEDVLGLLENGGMKQSLMAAPLYKWFYHKATGRKLF